MTPTARRTLTAVLLCLFALGLAASPAQAARKRPATPRPPLPAPFARMPAVQEFIQQMHEKHQFDVAGLQQIFQQVRPIPAVQKAVMPPRDPSIRSWQEYRRRFIEPRRIEQGELFWQTHASLLNQASTESGVPEEIIVAIIGIESIYGKHMGSFGTLAALATLAFEYPKINPATDANRAALFRQQLEELLLLARDETRPPLDYKGSYAGALGFPQFLPGSIRQYGKDGDKDGHIRLESSPADAIASVANFLAKHGWKKGEPIVARAQISGEAHSTLIAEGILPRRGAEELGAFGVQPLPGGPAFPAHPAALIDLVSPQQDTEYWLGFQNFYVITRYNRSSFYAMAVHDLAQVLREKHEMKQATTHESLNH